MPKKAKPLTDPAIRKATPGKNIKFLFDGGGLFLQISPGGSKLWRYRYLYRGARNMMSLGDYPAVSLADAREEKRKADRLIEQGQNPAAVKRQQKALDISRRENTFQALAEAYYAGRERELAPGTLKTIRRSLGRDVFPYVGTKPIQDFTRDDIKTLLRRILDRGAVTQAQQTALWMEQVFTYADDLGLITSNPATPIKRTLPAHRPEHRAAITDPQRLGELLRCIAGYRGTPVVRAALAILPVIACRPDELRSMEWAGINLESREWRYTVSKVRRLHIVPLPRQVVEILRELQPLTGAGRYVFQAPYTTRERPISNNTIGPALQVLGFGPDEVVPHGFRTTFRTLGEEVLRFRPDLLEMHISHKMKTPLGRTYARMEYIDDRRKMMQEWADYLDGLKTGNIRLGKVA